MIYILKDAVDLIFTVVISLLIIIVFAAAVPTFWSFEWYQAVSVGFCAGMISVAWLKYIKQ